MCDTCLSSCTMSDDAYSASELRRRYQRGGTAKDSDLSAAQLRSRYGIENSKHGEHLRCFTGRPAIVLVPLYEVRRYSVVFGSGRRMIESHCYEPVAGRSLEGCLTCDLQQALKAFTLWGTL
jgi:hypothetical protein